MLRLSTTIKWLATVPVPAGGAVRVEGFAIKGKMDVTWTGKESKADSCWHF